MNLWRATYWDPVRGFRTVWGESASDAVQRVAEIRRNELIADDESPQVSLVVLPTHKRGLLAWLNQHAVQLSEAPTEPAGP